MRLVRFENGKYGVRTHWFFGWHFMDLKCRGFSWKIGSEFFPDCMASQEAAEAAFRLARLPYEIIE